MQNVTIALTTILGYSAMSGIIGGGGLGKVAIDYGYYRYKYLVMYAAVILLIILVQIFQSVGTRLALKSDKKAEKNKNIEVSSLQLRQKATKTIKFRLPFYFAVKKSHDKELLLCRAIFICYLQPVAFINTFPPPCAAIAAAAAASAFGSGNICYKRLCGEYHSGNGRSVLKSRTCYLSGVKNTCLKHIDIFFLREVKAVVLLAGTHDFVYDNRTFKGLRS